MKRDFLYAAIAWVVLTLLGEYIVLAFDLFPVQAAEQAVVIDEAFRLLLILGTPVFTLVVVGLVYGVLQFRSPVDPSETGPPVRTNGPLTLTWLAVTSGLAIFVIFNPGLKGIEELRSESPPDIVVEVTARKWNWTFTFPDSGVVVEDADELVLPVGKRVRFDVTSADIIHSFWVPGFRMKIDAMPGQTNSMVVTTMRTGDFAGDPNYRVQCAELCGTGHPRMRANLRIVEEQEFEAWLEQFR